MNCYTEGEESPLTNVNDGGFMKVDAKAEKKQVEDIKKNLSPKEIKKYLIPFFLSSGKRLLRKK